MRKIRNIKLYALRNKTAKNLLKIRPDGFCNPQSSSGMIHFSDWTTYLDHKIGMQITKPQGTMRTSQRKMPLHNFSVSMSVEKQKTGFQEILENCSQELFERQKTNGTLNKLPSPIPLTRFKVFQARPTLPDLSKKSHKQTSRCHYHFG